MTLNDLIERWRRAEMRAQEEQVRILDVHGEYRATSSSQPFGSYRLWKSEDGWACECVANSEHGVPCKHLAALSDLLGFDLISDVRLSPEVMEVG